MTISYPSALPPANIQGFTLTPQQNIIRTDMESGPARQRRRFTREPTIATVSWLFTIEEMSIFEYWFDNIAEHGAAWFSVQIISGKGVQSVNARFTEPWNAAARPGYFTVSAKLEIENIPTITEAQYNTLTGA